ncbi:MAG: EamA family transporter [Proteobacteria bacterium]|nr:EamA family transporter [Pseudomonadota bacterium]
MTPLMIATLGLAIVGQIVYQLGQRAVPANASPFAVLVVAYFVAGVLSLCLAWPFGAATSNVSLRSAFAWPTWLIALSIVAIELGYLTAYRSGWTVGTAFAVAGTATILILALVGWVFLGNSLTVRQVAGLTCSCAGVWLLAGGMRAG